MATLEQVRTLQAKAMAEDEVDAHVRQVIARFPAVRGHHHLDSRGTTAGCPDWLIYGPNGAIVRENKREGKKPTAAQQYALDCMSAAGWNVGVWTPSDVLSGRIVAEIRAIA